MATTGEQAGRQQRPTIRQVAEMAGVSAATVSRVLSGNVHVSEDVRKNVMHVVEQQGYSTGRARAQNPTLVSVTLPLVHHSYFSQILAGASEAFYEQGIPMVLCPTLHHHAREVTLLDRLMQGTTDGALLILPEESSEELAALAAHGRPFVIVDPHIQPEEHVPTVSASHASGASEAVEHLLALGHRRIAAITGPSGWIATEERLRGYRGALGLAGLTPDPALQIESDFSTTGGLEATQRLLALPDPPTAVFAFNDMLAIGVIQAARERGLRVPEDLSVVGFDDTFEASIVLPALTTVRQPLAEMGRMAVNQLVRLMQRHRIEALHVELATKLVIRDSTAAPRS
jgi:LacI family transcriptional regulator